MDNKRIIIIDDSSDYLKFIEASLRMIAENASIVSFLNIAKSKSILEKEPADLVLCDINFNPDNDRDRQGLEFLGWYRLKYPQHPIFMMTRYLDQGFKEEAINLGATGFLEKPLRIDQMKGIIRNHL